MYIQTKVFNSQSKIKNLISLATTNKYSAKKLAKMFNCDRKTIHKVLNKNGIFLPNLGRFKKKVFCDINFFINLSPISAYWAGFIVADGCLFSKNKSLSFGLKKSDIIHLEKFKKAIKTNAKISHIKSNRSVHITICSQELFSSLIKLGITPMKSSRIKKIKIPHTLMPHFIRGVYDGDGSISGNKVTHVQFQIAGFKPLLQQFQDILIKKCKVSKVKIYLLSKNSKVSKLQYTGSQIFKILDFVYKESIRQTRLDRKYKKYLNLKKRFGK